MSRKVFDQVQELIIRRPSNVVQSLSNMLKRECRSAEVVIVDEKFLPFFLYLTPFSADAYLADNDKPEMIYPNMKRFVQEQGREALATNQTVSLNTLKLQFFYIRSCFDLNEIAEKNCKEIRRRTRITLKQVLRTNHPRAIDSRERLLNRITTLVEIENGIGDDTPNMKETEAAVKSVLSVGDLELFIRLKKRDKLDVLEDLKAISCGIRLFNNDAGHEHAAKIIDLTLVIEKSFDNTRIMLEYELEQSRKHIQEATNKILESGVLNSPLPQPEELDDTMLQYLKDISVYVHQRHKIITAIFDGLMEKRTTIQETINAYQKALKDIHAILIYKTAINSQDIFPHFKLLGTLWKKLQHYVYFLSEINIFLDKLHSLEPICDYLKDIGGGGGGSTATGSTPSEKGPMVMEPSRMSPKKAKPGLDSDCEYWNYCTWALSLGFMLPIGGGEGKSHVSKFNNRKYAFSSEEYLKSFERDPQIVLLDVVRNLYERPEIMIFLERSEEFSHLMRVQNQEFRRAFYAARDSNCQTEEEEVGKQEALKIILHRMRRKGLQLANQMNYTSNYCQTEGVYNVRYSSSTQTIDKKPKAAQTKTLEDKAVQTEM